MSSPSTSYPLIQHLGYLASAVKRLSREDKTERCHAEERRCSKIAIFFEPPCIQLRGEVAPFMDLIRLKSPGDLRRFDLGVQALAAHVLGFSASIPEPVSQKSEQRHRTAPSCLNGPRSHQAFRIAAESSTVDIDKYRSI